MPNQRARRATASGAALLGCDSCSSHRQISCARDAQQNEFPVQWQCHRDATPRQRAALAIDQSCQFSIGCGERCNQLWAVGALGGEPIRIALSNFLMRNMSFWKND